MHGLDFVGALIAEPVSSSKFPVSHPSFEKNRAKTLSIDLSAKNDYILYCVNTNLYRIMLMGGF